MGDEYVEAIDSGQHPVERGLMLSEDDRMVRALIGTLMCHYELDIRAFEKEWGVDLSTAFPDAWPRLESLAADDLIRLPQQDDANPRLQVTPEGRYLIRNVAMAFDRYLPAQTTGF